MLGNLEAQEGNLHGWDRGREAESRDEVRALKGPDNRVGLGVRWSHGQI